MTEGRAALEQTVGSLPYRTWAALPGSKTDAGKVSLEMAGQHRPSPSSAYAKGLVRLARLHPATPAAPPEPPSGIGLLAKRFAFYRNPRGGVENVAAAKSAGLGLAFLNIGDFLPEEWGKLTVKLDANQIEWGYWAHCRTLPQLEALLNRSREKARPVVGLNIENELASILPPAVIVQAVTQSGYLGQATTVLLGWVQNGVDCRPIGDWPALLEIFPQDAPALWPADEKVADCLSHARTLGLKYPIPVYGTYPDDVLGEAKPSWYNMALHHGLYAVDDTGEDWQTWGWT